MAHKIWRSPYSHFGGLISVRPNDQTDETLTAVGVYTDGELARIAAEGFNAIWLHGVIANLVRVEPFTELGANRGAHLAAVNTLIERAARHNLKVFLYTQPLRAVAVDNQEFWERHAALGGQEEFATEQVVPATLNQRILFRCLCTSTEPVKRWHRMAMAQLAGALPGLGGVILITASEYPAHCYSHRHKVNPAPWAPLIECPRCKEREPWEVAAELVRLMRDGVRDVSQSIDVIAWNWGWGSYLPPPCRELVEALPQDVILMADFERGGHMDLPARPHFPINEYSLLYGGPSELCRGSHDVARARGMRVMSKLQLGTTHELATVVSLPLLGSVYDKALYHRRHPGCGYMGCWNFGNMTSANTTGFNYFLDAECPADKQAALERFAARYFEGCSARLVAEAWELFDAAMQYFPFTIPFLYNGVHSHALAYGEIYRPGPLRGEPAGCSYLNLGGRRGDDLSASVEADGGEFSLDETIERLGKLAVLWEVGVGRLKEGLKGCDERHELGNAIIVGALWRSAENAYKTYRLRKNWSDAKRAELSHVIKDELAAVGTAMPWVEKDPRQGHHGEAQQRFFSPGSMAEKMATLEKRLE